MKWHINGNKRNNATYIITIYKHYIKHGKNSQSQNYYKLIYISITLTINVTIVKAWTFQ